MRKILKISIAYVLLGLVSTVSIAADIMSLSDRKDLWEISLQSHYLEAKDISFEGGAEANLNRTNDFGFGLGYNFDEHFALDIDFNYSDVGYTGKRVLEAGGTEPIQGTLTTSSMLVTGIYNFLAKRFTPFVGATVGYTFVDTNIATGPPQSGLCYYPYYGYISCAFQPTKTTTEFTYGATAGLRFDVKENVFLRLSAGKRWIDFGGATSSTDFTTYRFDVGLMF